jgi:hypothetical protein
MPYQIVCFLHILPDVIDASPVLLTGGSLMTDGRVTQIFRKEKMRSNNSNDGNYLLLRGILSKCMSSNVL